MPAFARGLHRSRRMSPWDLGGPPSTVAPCQFKRQHPVNAAARQPSSRTETILAKPGTPWRQTSPPPARPPAALDNAARGVKSWIMPPPTGLPHPSGARRPAEQFDLRKVRIGTRSFPRKRRLGGMVAARLAMGRLTAAFRAGRRDIAALCRISRSSCWFAGVMAVPIFPCPTPCWSIVRTLELG